MRKFYLIFFILLTLVFAGCKTDETHKAKLMTYPPVTTGYSVHKTTNPTDEKIRLLKAETEAKARLAQIEAKKAENLKKLETQEAIATAKIEANKTQIVKELELRQTQSTNTANTQIAAANAQVTIATEKERQKAALARRHEEIIFYRELLIVGALILLLLMIFIYLLYRHRQNLKLQLHKEELRHQAYLEESRQHHEKVTKVLEIIVKEDLDKGVKKELTKLLSDQKSGSKKLLES